MDIAQTLRYLFPDVNFRAGGDCLLQDDGAGVYIARWDRPEPQPTPEQIEAARKPAALAAITAIIRDDCERRQFTEGVPFGGVRWQSDEKSRGRYAFLMGFAQITLMSGGTMASPIADPATQQPVVWNAMGGVQVPLTVGLLLGMLQAAAARENACDATYRAHVAAAALLDDPLTYDYSGGWPE